MPVAAWGRPLTSSFWVNQCPCSYEGHQVLLLSSWCHFLPGGGHWRPSLKPSSSHHMPTTQAGIASSSARLETHTDLMSTASAWVRSMGSCWWPGKECHFLQRAIHWQISYAPANVPHPCACEQNQLNSLGPTHQKDKKVEEGSRRGPERIMGKYDLNSFCSLIVMSLGNPV